MVCNSSDWQPVEPEMHGGKAIPFPQRNAAAERGKAGLEPGASNGTLSVLVEDWWKEAKAAGRKQSTYESYQKTMMKLVAFLKHDEAGRVTPEDIVRFKDHRLLGGASAKTVKDSDLAGLKTVFGWAVMNRRMHSNPRDPLSRICGSAGDWQGRGRTWPARASWRRRCRSASCIGRSGFPATGSRR
jgi:hypothetical protein